MRRASSRARATRRSSASARRCCVVDEASGRENEFTLVGPTEADLKTGKLSSESPVARALVGARAGDTVSVQTPGGERRYKVERVG